MLRYCWSQKEVRWLGLAASEFAYHSIAADSAGNFVVAGFAPSLAQSALFLFDKHFVLADKLVLKSQSSPRSPDSHLHSLQTLRLADSTLLFAAPLAEPYDLHVLLLGDAKLLACKVLRKKGPNRKIRRVLIKKNIACLTKASADSLLVCGEYFNTCLLTVSFAETQKKKSLCTLI